mgnify:CR=1 FL=1
MLNHENLLKQTNADQERLTEVLQNIQRHHSFLQEQFDAYKQYLGNVRQQSVCSRGKQTKEEKKKSKKDKKNKKDKQKGPFKYSHSQLEKDGIIIESEAPEDRFVNLLPLIGPFIYFVPPQTKFHLFFIFIYISRRI